MAVYSSLGDYQDDTFTVDDRLMQIADAKVNALLSNRGIVITSVTLPNLLLTQLAVTFASYQACIESAAGENSLLIDKAKHYKTMTDELLQSITKAGLGIVESSGMNFCSVSIGRG